MTLLALTMRACKRLAGASGVVKLNKQTIQVVGAKAESIGDEMKKVVARGRSVAASADAAHVATLLRRQTRAVPKMR